MFEHLIRPAVGVVLAAAAACGGSGSTGSTTPQGPRMPTTLPKTPEGLAQAQAGGRAIGCEAGQIQYGTVSIRCGARGIAMFSINRYRDTTADVSCISGEAAASPEACAKLAEDIIAAGRPAEVVDITGPVVVPAFDPNGKNEGSGRVTATTQVRAPEWGAEVEVPVSQIKWLSAQPGWMLTVSSDDAMWVFSVTNETHDRVVSGQREVIEADGATTGELRDSSYRLAGGDTKQFDVTMSRSRGAGLFASVGRCTVSVVMITRNQDPAHVSSMLERGASMIHTSPEGTRCQ